MRKLPIILIALFFAISTKAQNNSFESAVLIPTAGLTTELNTGSDRFYYRLVVTQNATLNFSIDGKKLTGGTQGINVYFYDKSGRSIFSKTGIGNGTAAGANIKETISIHSLSPDTIYVLLMKNSDHSYSFNLKHNLSQTGNTDAEPNNEREKAVPVNHNQAVQGHIGYKANGKIDHYDYYKILPPANGTIKVYVEGVNTSEHEGSFGMYFYDKSGRNIFSKAVIGKAVKSGESLKDTLTIYSRNADTIYFSVYQNSYRSFHYNFKYEVIDRSTEDVEPNNTMPTALNFNKGETKKGQINYVTNGKHDSHDYYKTLIPQNGTVRVFLEGKHTGGPDGTFGFYAYDKSGRNILSKSSVAEGKATLYQNFKDTINVYSRDIDTLYFLIYKSGSNSFQYGMSYDVVAQSPSDQEPNNSFATANTMQPGEVKEGQIGHTEDGKLDNYDYYKTLLPGDGTVTIYVEAEHTGGSAGSFGVYAYDKSGRNIFSKASVGKSITLGQTLKDTMEIVSRAQDSIYITVYQNTSRSFNYKLSYELLDQSLNDDEPNNSTKDAKTIIAESEVAGHIGYTHNGILDNYDYYKTLLPEDGTIRVIINALHTGGSNGSIGFYMLDKSGRNIFSKSSIGKSISRGQSTSDTLYLTSRTADTVYMYVYQNTSRSFSYTFTYDIIDKGFVEPEPNNSVATAIYFDEKEVMKGHIGYTADGKLDNYDYYRTVLPSDGTIKVNIEAKHTGGSAGSFGFYMLDKGGRNVFSKSTLGKSASYLQTIKDTLFLRSRADDTLTMYVYQNSARSFQYSFSYEMIDLSENDELPNESYETATEISADETVNGHIGYTNNGKLDNYDYYKTLLPVDGTVTIYVEGTNTGNNSSRFGFYAYDKQKRNIFGKSALGSKNVAFGETLRDTLIIESRASDSIYLVVYQNSSNSFSYNFRYEMPGTLQGDPEPNNNFGQAAQISLQDTLKGLIGYVQSGTRDSYDYFIAGINKNSSLKIYVEGEHTGGSAGSFSVYAYDKNRRTLFSKAAVGTGTFNKGDILKDTLLVNCNATDSIYILVYQGATRSFSYNLRFEEIDNAPKANFTYTRTGNDFGFVNNSKNTNSFVWNFGNGTTGNVSMPVVNYKPGVYNVRLIATNATCNFRDTMQQTLTITGIEKFTPTSSGKGGDLNMQIFGGGLDTSAKVKLIKGSRVIEPEEKFDNGAGSMLGLVFDLHFAETGVYDMEVVFSNGDVIRYDEAFTIEGMIYPTTYSEIVGPAIWRAGRTANFNLVVGNKGNTMARGVIVVMAWPKSAKLEFYGKQYSPNPEEFIDVEMEEYNESISSSFDLVKWIYDSINTVTPIDTFGLEPYDGFARFLYVPVIPPNSTYELPFTITSNNNAKHKLITYTVKPNQFGSCETFNIYRAFTGPAAVELMINSLDWAIDESKLPKTTKIPAQVAVKTLKVTQKHIDVSSNVLAHRMWASYYNWRYGGGGENHGLTDSEYYDYYKEGLAADEFAKNQLQDIAIDQGINIVMPGKAKRDFRKNQLNEQILDNNKLMLNKKTEYLKLNSKTKGKTKAWRMKKQEAADEWRKAFESGEEAVGELTRIETLEAMADAAGKAKNLKGEIEALIKYIKENCPEHEEALKELEDKLNKELDIIDEKEKDTESSTSYDPNAIYGPTGFNQQRYVNSTDRHPFMIMFENVDTAKADAQIVRIENKIDKTKFDLSSFEFGNITIGGKWYRLPRGRQNVMMEIDLKAERNMLVRLNASLDTATGMVTWLFTSIDPVTRDLPDFDGFLPPNVNYPNGEGSVTYTINPRKNLAHGTVLNSQANIFFDFNEPILTNEWINTIDANKPNGSIQVTLESDSLIVLNYKATDAESGVKYYNLYASNDNINWTPIGGGNLTQQTFPATPGETYYFYVEAQDRVGNRDRKQAIGEAMVKMPEAEIPGVVPGELSAYPNPVTGNINIELNVPQEQQVTINLFSVTGTNVLELYNANSSGNIKFSRNLTKLPNGIYFIHAKGSKGLKLYKKIVVMR